MTDRIARSYEMRLAIHTFLAAHPHSSMERLAAAFPHLAHGTLRKAVARLIQCKNVVMQGSGKNLGYSAIGESVTSAEEIRQRMRKGCDNILHLCAYNQDRVAKAWQQRQAIHAYVKANPLVRMSSIVKAFPDTPKATVHKHVCLLRKQGNLTMHGFSVSARYSCATSEIYEIEAIREQLRSNGRAVGNLSVERALANEARIDEAAAAADPEQPWRTVNRPDRQRPHANQGGQGAYAGWRGNGSGCSLERVA